MEKMVASPKEWIDGSESAKAMLDRVLTARPLLLLPPLHRVPLRVGNVVELVGTSPAAKTHILIQVLDNDFLLSYLFSYFAPLQVYDHFIDNNARSKK